MHNVQENLDGEKKKEIKNADKKRKKQHEAILMMKRKGLKMKLKKKECIIYRKIFMVKTKKEIKNTKRGRKQYVTTLMIKGKMKSKIMTRKGNRSYIVALMMKRKKLKM